MSQKTYNILEVIGNVLTYVEQQTDMSEDLVEALAAFGIEITETEADSLLYEQTIHRKYDNGDPRVSAEDFAASQNVLPALIRHYAERNLAAQAA